ncbi:MAG: hypothetical protein Q9159_006994 [Coniocarpon cinnabarinum]
MFSSQSQKESGISDDSSDEDDGETRVSGKPEPPRWEDTLCLLHFALFILRAPVTVRDVLDWTQREDFTFKNPERAIPKEALHRLDINWRRRLYLRNRALSPGQLHRRMLQLSVAFADTEVSGVALEFPELNHALLLSRWINELNLPMPVFPSVEGLTNMLGMAHMFPQVKDAKGELPIVLHPELRLLALLVLTVKMQHPFDGISRHPYSDDDPSALVIDWNLWNKQHSSLPRSPLRPESTERQGPKDHWDVKATDIPLMNTTQMDDYLDWFERTLLPPTSTDDPTENANNDFEREVWALFPLNYGRNEGDCNGRDDEEILPRGVQEERDTLAKRERTKVITAGLLHRSAVPVKPNEDGGNGGVRRGNRAKHGTMARPGDDIKPWKSVDDIGSDAQLFIERCAHLGGVDAEILVKSVASLERRLRDWTQKEEKEQRREPG